MEQSMRSVVAVISLLVAICATGCDDPWWWNDASMGENKGNIKGEILVEDPGDIESSIAVAVRWFTAEDMRGADVVPDQDDYYDGESAGEPAGDQSW